MTFERLAMDLLRLVYDLDVNIEDGGLILSWRST